MMKTLPVGIYLRHMAHYLQVSFRPTAAHMANTFRGEEFSSPTFLMSRILVVGTEKSL